MPKTVKNLQNKSNIYVFEFEDNSKFITDDNFDIREADYFSGFFFITKDNTATKGQLRKVTIQ